MKIKILLLSLCIVIYSGCKNDAKQNVQSHSTKRIEISGTDSPDIGFGQYVRGFTSGVISARGSIMVELNSSPKDSAKALKDKIFSFEPGVKGKVQWTESGNIVFTPDGNFKPDTKYKVKFNLGALADVPAKFKTMEFSVRTITQSVRPGDILLRFSEESSDIQYLDGVFYTADYVEDKDFEKIVKISGIGDERVFWSHESGVKHFFKVENLKMGNNSKNITVSWNASSLGVDQKDEIKLELPAADDFKIMRVDVVPDKRYIRVLFSNPLKRDQEIRGLVTVDGVRINSYQTDRNEFRIYFDRAGSGKHDVTIFKGIKNENNKPLEKGTIVSLDFEDVKPAARLVGNGHILPASGDLVIPFEAVNLKAIDVRLVRIMSHNVHYFFQDNDISRDYGLKEFGRLVLQKAVDLQSTGFDELKKWNRYSINLADLTTIDPGAIYSVQLRFRKEYSLYGKESPEAVQLSLTSQQTEQTAFEEELAGWDEPGWMSSYYYPSGFDWSESDDPDNFSYYYGERFPKRNYFGTNLGVIAKAGSDLSMNFAVTNLISTQPEQGVNLNLYNYQKELLQTVQTDSKGMASVRMKNKPFMLVAEKNGQFAYLKIDDGSSLSLSNFDVSGEVVQKGVKGFIYGERGVWRPGENIYLTFVVDDKDKNLPEGHPVIFDLINPRGQIADHQVKTKGENGFYCFTTQTDYEAETGNWNAKIQVGGRIFYQRVKVETVKPNRLKIDLNLGEKETLEPGSVYGELKAEWLHGAVARNLKADISVIFSKIKTTFKGFDNFVFDSPAGEFYAEEEVVFEGKVDDNGKTRLNIDMPDYKQTPGMLRAHFTTRVFEETGDFSIDVKSINFSP